MNTLANQLDLERFLANFANFLARPKEVTTLTLRPSTWEHLQEFESLDFAPPSAIICLKEALKAFKKGGVWRLEILFEFVKITRYFAYLKARACPKEHPHVCAYLENIHFPAPLLELEACMQDVPALKEGFYPELDALLESLGRLQVQQKQVFNQILSRSTLQLYLADRQVHFVQGIETLLLKPGFSAVLKGAVVARSHSGQFYIEPLEVKSLARKIQETRNKIEESVAYICAQWSQKLRPYFLFLRFINHEFDYIDHLQARICFAKSANLSFIKPNAHGYFVLKDFEHPNLNNPKPLCLDFNQALLLVTGVNTGGKTMLLKSILSATWLAKHFLPFKINAHHSQIPHIENIQAIINDPQNSQNDISTFAGRMLDFSHALTTPHLLLGVDEIELGTDASEASCLYKVLLETLLAKGAKVVVTTHHKHLAMLLAKNPAVQLLAANYDLQAQMPTYTFTPGLIGKSYAFESALRYGVPLDLIEQARALYGAEQTHLNALIERTSALEQELLNERAQLEYAKQAHAQSVQAHLAQMQDAQEQQEVKQRTLEKSYQQALRALQDALKEFERTHNKSHAHQQIQAIREGLKLTKPPESKSLETSLTIGMGVVYGKQKGQIVGLSGELFVVLLENGLKIKTRAHALKVSHTRPQAPKPQVKLECKPQAHARMRLDVRALEVQEALEQAQDFLANALLAGFEEVLIVHGKGKGILRQALKGWLKTHPKVISFEDAPYNLGGSGAQIIKI
ncbi:endonuclease MutS2 [Helicobacter salomonis]|uniref:endonuclease MutS2 n=1 Tax=Helicobacter salomonis TaxID=56878 RepID=UPI000CF12F90|nr:Smr/MutS family protein [Helicobacter salomonis]